MLNLIQQASRACMADTKVGSSEQADSDLWETGKLILQEYLANFRSTITADGLYWSGNAPSSIQSRVRQREHHLLTVTSFGLLRKHLMTLQAPVLMKLLIEECWGFKCPAS